MCWLIFAGVRGYRGDPVQVIKARGYVAEPSRNPTSDQMGPGVLTVRDANCSCALYIPTQRYVGENTALMRARYRRKGWPEGRIERTVKARCEASEKRAARRGALNVFPAMVAELAEAGAEVALLAHFFDGSLEEPFAVRASRKMTLAEYLGNGGAFPEDELVTIVR